MGGGVYGCGEAFVLWAHLLGIVEIKACDA
jgi:hypothetical protein